jgi:DNA mismatch repair ATPase MutS
LCAQIGLLWITARPVRKTFDLAAARQGVAEAFEQMLAVVEQARFESPLLQAMQQRLALDGIPPSRHMRNLKSWSSSAELRQQFLFYILVNPLTLWDLHVLRGLERWNQRVGRRTVDWFAALGELEALCSLATLAFGDRDARMPEVTAAGGPLRARALAHPLLVADSRVSNDVELKGPGTALLVTGSNMAGKSTLLRALGLNTALALAGGPVCAEALLVPLCRLRASMRAEDSLQTHASYFQAELQKLRTVVEDAEAQPPVLFLLDELLRGTNARARHIGARAVLLHLLKRSAMGLVATHDVALAALEREYPDKVKNVHFTDVIENGEMRFDYRLREGVVRTSNALRLLAMAGIDVAADDSPGLETH